ncbi:MAG: GntR family transcriptional regulator [Lachnospiraceae bacterium]|jgi:DNA-binding GntR family transcriptional regulator|nr:GntR family transcriptional regulator [Lachnospiraceae bacterium]
MTENLKLKQNEYLPLRDVVFITLREAILKGELQPGERLMEVKLANQLGVSRTPIREAIRMLQLEGLVLMVPRKGAEVSEISEQNLEDVLEVREALEELSVKLACERMTDEDYENLDIAEQNFQKVIENGDLMSITEADVHFHDVINEASRNQKLIGLLNNFREQMYRFRIEYLKREEVRPSLVNEHNELIEALKARDVEKSGVIIKEHIKNQAMGVRDTIQEKKKTGKKRY